MTHRPLSPPLRVVAMVTALCLLIPATAMQFTREVDWGPGDFLAAAVLLFGAGSAIVIARRHVARSGARRALTAVIVAGALLAWAELAVGLFH